MEDVEKTVKRLLKLPSLINWARHNKKRVDDTANRLRAFALRPPRHSLQPVTKICAQMSYGKLTYSSAVEKIEEIQHPIARVAAREIIPAFSRYLTASGIQGVEELEKFGAMYLIGKNPDGDPLPVPIKPSFIGIKSDKLVPVFIIGWASLNLDDFQKSLISSIVCDSILTQQDFLDSDAEIIAFPRIKKTKYRELRSWSTREYDLLSQDDLAAQFDRYSRALRLVISELRGE